MLKKTKALISCTIIILACAIILYRLPLITYLFHPREMERAIIQDLSLVAAALVQYRDIYGIIADRDILFEHIRTETGSAEPLRPLLADNWLELRLDGDGTFLLLSYDCFIRYGRVHGHKVVERFKYAIDDTLLLQKVHFDCTGL